MSLKPLYIVLLSCNLDIHGYWWRCVCMCARTSYFCGVYVCVSMWVCMYVVCMYMCSREVVFVQLTGHV